MKTFKKNYGIVTFVIFVLLWIHPFKFLYRNLRIGVFKTLWQIIIAPFGNVKFQTYLLAEILTDCIIQSQDFGKIIFFFIDGNWDQRLIDTKISKSVNMHKPAPLLKWYLYITSFLPYYFRFQQNLRKWLVYGHKLQAWNALKYVTLMLGPICLIIYLEFGTKGFFYGYIFWKIVSSTFKTFWDFYYDWGLLRGT